MLATACLCILLSLWAVSRGLELLLRTLRLDPWDVLLYLGLAEHRLPERTRARLG